ncbi:SseB family protein [Nocardioides limicola]|uniref:SseB family protein n=1 Tax=Nocardioides limicola TaxID=2803368 RepID=UPI00193B6C83|nr:SseB family protein [Nocardioides sp. DJM-14]
MTEVNGTRPPTVLEAAIQAHAEGDIEAEALLWVLASSVLLLPEVEADGETVALVIEEDGGDCLALFTDVDQVPDLGEFEPAFDEISGVEALFSLPDDTGIAVNPGSEASFSIDAQNATMLRDHLADHGLRV